MKSIRLKLGHKFLAGTLGIILLLGLLLIVFIRSALTHKLILEIQEKGIYIAKHLAEASSTPLLTEHVLNLQMIINEQISDSDVEYVFIRDAQGGITAHTFKGGFPAALIDMNIPEASQEYSIGSFVSEGMTMYDIAVPIMKGNLGAIHVGISESFIRGSVYDVVRLILEIIAGVLILGAVMSVIFAKRITKPLSELVDVAQEIGEGNLEKVVPVRTMDEIARLGSVFNQMIGNLKNTTVSRNHLDNIINSMIDMVVVIDREFRIKSVNCATTYLLEYSPEEMIGRDFTMLWSGKETCSITPEKLFEKGRISNIEAFYKTKAGIDIPVVISASTIRDAASDPSIIVIVAKDITERKKAEDELRHSYEFTKTVLNSMNDSILIIDVRDFSILGVNHNFLLTSGLKEEEVLGKKCHAVTHNRHDPCMPPDDECPLLETIKTGKHAIAEHIHYDHKGEKQYVEINTLPIFNEKGELIQAVHIARDITERKVADEVLREKQQELILKHNELNALFREVEITNKERQKIMDSVGDMIILTDEEGRIKRVNETVAKFTKKSYKEVLGESWEDLIHEAGMEAMTLHADSTELIHAPTHKWFALNAYPFEDPELNFSGTVITLHETTEIKTIAEELEKTNREIDENRNKLQSALDEISRLMGGVIQASDHSVRFTNPDIKKCYELKNCKKEECPCYGKEAMRCWKVAGTYCGGKVQGAFAQKYGSCSECDVYKKATTDPIYQIGEHFNNMMHILEVNNKKLEKAYEELKATQSQMLQREKMASVGQLAAGVAHEINNPTGFILSNLGTLRKYVNKLSSFIDAQAEAVESLNAGEAPEGLKETRKKLKLDYVLEDIEQLITESMEGADRIKNIVQNLKSFSRIDEAEYKPVNINDCIESTLHIVWNEIKYKATVDKEYGKLPMIKCFPQQLNQVFVNLLVNAAQAIEKQGVIKIKTWNGNGFVNVSISDSGCGIPDDKLHRIFEPFFTTKPVGKGTGLGLSITYDIVKKHKGDIKVESVVGNGTVFTVKIPVVEEV